MYQSFYNFSTKPFQLSPDPRFFFGSKGHKRVLAYLRYGVHQGDGFIVVTGDVGTGKTTLVRTLLEELEGEKDVVAAQLVTTQLEADDLLRAIAGAFKLSHEGVSKSGILQNLERFLREQQRENKHVLLIVDEAQNLPIQSLEELRMLSNFQEGHQPLFQSFLLGQNEFRKILRADYLEQFRQRIIASYHLGPLNLDETKSYIEHRMRMANWGGDPSFTAEAYAAIYDYTGGVPRRINTLCDRVLLLGCLEESHEIGDVTVKTVTQELNDEAGVRPGDSAADIPMTAGALTGALTGSLNVSDMTLEQRVQRLEEIIEKGREFLQVLLRSET